MKKVSVLIFGIISSALLVSMSLAKEGYDADAQPQPQAQEQATDLAEEGYDAAVQPQPQAQEQDTDIAEEGYDADAQPQPQAQEQGSYKYGDMARSWVSQSKIDTVVKREEAVAQRDKKLLIRAKNVQSNENITDSSSLFRSSK